AARTHDDAARFLEERNGALVLLRDLVERRDRREAARILRMGARADKQQPERALHTASVRANGRWRTDCPVSTRQAFATAGPMGGTPGSPTPVGFSAERTTSTSMRGISPMRSIR